MRIALRLVALLLPGLLAGAAQAVPDFTFVQLTDLHVPFMVGETRQTVAALPVGPVTLAPYGRTVPAPAFALTTGDLNEFGGGRGWWQQYLDLWRNLPYPVYHELGNHDVGYDCNAPRLVKLHGALCYAFEQFGCKFIGFCTATPQDPRPSIPAGGLAWLRQELAGTPPEQPVFVFLHHPPEGGEFASRYDQARLLDVLQTRNVVLLITGHGHGARAWQIGGLDVVMGGDTYSAHRGYSILSVQDNVLRVCHQYLKPEPKLAPLLEKPLPPRSPLRQITRLEPGDGAVFTPGQPLRWAVRLEPGPAPTAATWQVDEGAKGDLVRQDDEWLADAPRGDLAPGAHTVRLQFTSEGRVTSRTLAFWLDDGPVRLAWKQALPGSVQGTPLILGDTVYVGSDDGSLTAGDLATGAVRWRYRAGDAIRGVAGDDLGVYCGSADGKVYALTTAGQVRWQTDIGNPVYAPVALAGEQVVCATSAGEVLALDRRDGTARWRTPAASYSIETRPCVSGDGVFVGAWDRYLYALDLATGAGRWKSLVQGSDRQAAPEYYSPSECAPVVVGGKVWAVDRAGNLNSLDAATGQRLAAEPKAGGVGPAGDDEHFYVRHGDGRLTRRDAEGKVLWTAQVPTGSIPTPPVEVAGEVHFVSSLGLWSCLQAETGALLAQYKAGPGLFVYGAPAVAGKRVVVADMGGNLVCLERK